jgi:hypothetical protein
MLAAFLDVLVMSTLISELSDDGSQANRYRAVCGVP